MTHDHRMHGEAVVGEAVEEPTAERHHGMPGHDDPGGHDHGDHQHDDHGGHDHGGHDHSHHDPAQFRRKFWLSLVLTIPTLVFSTGLQDILGLSGPRFPGSVFIPAVFGTVLFVYGGLVFLRGGVQEVRAKQPGMMALISLAIVVAFGYSLAVTLGLPGMDFWWELATLITIMLLGHWIEMAAVMSASDALGELAKLLPDEADVVLADGGTERRDVAALRTGDTVLVRPGASVPADGDVIDGQADADESLLTGESAPVAKQTGDRVVAGSTIAGGSLTVRVTGAGDDTALAGIMRLVAEAQASKSRTQLLADRAAGWLFAISVMVAVITAVAWAFLRPEDPGFVLERVVTVLVIACPHALGLAIPIVAQLSTSIGARRGILIRSRAALEQARRVDVVLFDKTGTLTAGRQSVEAVVPAVGAGLDVGQVLQLAAAVEGPSEHAVGRAIVAEAAARGLVVLPVTRFEALPGRGASGLVEQQQVSVVAPRHLIEQGVKLPDGLVTELRDASAAGRTAVVVVTGGAAVALIVLGDAVRPESVDAVAGLKRAGVRVAMVTGDARGVADAVAAQLGIEEVFAEVLPGEKSDVVQRLQRDGSVVAMVGDGVNDAPALATADLGVAIGAGTDVAIGSAGVVLASNDPRGVLQALRLSRATYRKMLQNLFWATGYNALGLPLAAGVLAGIGVLLPPWFGAVLMSLSTVVVALNAQLLRRIRL